MVVVRFRHAGVEHYSDWAGNLAAELKPKNVLDVGCGDGSMLFRYFKQMSAEFYEVKGAPSLKAQAKARGFKVVSYDLNGCWPYEDNKFDETSAKIL